MKRVRLYLLFSFSLAWAIWIGCYMLKMPAQITLALNSVSMWAPAAALWLAQKTTGQEKILVPSLRPGLRKNVKWYLVAWLLPVLFAGLGAALYFMLFPQNFKPTPMHMRAIGILVAAPFINILFALGEELGWRGFLFPALAGRMTKIKAHLLVGVIWGLWHTPINMLGHNYGLAYPGYPWLGIPAMCVFTFSAGALLSWLTENSGSIWPAALAHGSINAFAGLALLFLNPDKPHNQLLGPYFSGLIPCLPLLMLAVTIIWRQSASVHRQSSIK